jgi:hypothetical protein
MKRGSLIGVVLAVLLVACASRAGVRQSSTATTTARTAHPEDDAAMLSILEAHRNRQLDDGRLHGNAAMLLTYFLDGPRVTIRGAIDENGGARNQRDVYDWAIQASHEHPSLVPDQLRELKAMLVGLPPEPFGVPRDEMVLVSSADSSGSWRTRIYDKRTLPASVRELFWILGTLPPDAGQPSTPRGPSASAGRVTVQLSKDSYTLGEPIELTISAAGESVAIDLAAAVEVRGGTASALGRRVFSGLPVDQGSVEDFLIAP